MSRVPNASDDVLIDNGNAANTVTISSVQTIHSLLARQSVAITAGGLTVGGTSELDAGFTLSNATLVANGVLTLVGNSQISSGVVQGSASVNNDATMTLAGSVTLATVLNNTGTIVHTSGTLRFDIATQFVTAFGTLNNSGLYDIQADVGFQLGTLQPASINNTGTFRKSGGSGTVAVSSPLPFNNNGATIDVESGVFSLAGGTHTGGTFLTGMGATLLLTGIHTFTGSYTGSGQGTVRLAGSRFIVGSSPATFNFPGNLLQWQTGRIQCGTAGLTNAGTMTLISGGSETILFGQINNAGTFIQSGVVALDLSGSATFTNLPGALFDFQGDGAIFDAALDAGPHRFISRGTLRKSQGTYSRIEASGFNTSGGTVEVLSGTLGIASGINEGGNFNVAAGAILDLTDGLNNFPRGFNVTYKGSFTGAGAGTVLVAGNFLTIDPGGATFNFPNGLFQWTGGLIGTLIPVGTTGNVGTLINTGMITLSGTGTKTLGGVLSNRGTIVHQSGPLRFDFGTQFVYAVGKLENSGLYDLQGDVALELGTVFPGSISNAGMFRKSAGTGNTSLSSLLAFSNTGSVEVRSGTLALGNTVAQVSGNTLTGGTWSVFANSTLVLPGSITSNQANVSLNGLGSTLAAINGLTSNAGSLSVLGGQTFTTASSLSNSGNLIVGPGSALNVTGNYSQTAPGTLTVQIDGRPANGRFGRLASTGNAVLAGTLNIVLQNGFGPTAGDMYAVLTFASHSGAFSTITGVQLFSVDLQPTSLTLTAQASGADLAVRAVNINATAAQPGQNISISYTVNNLGGTPATGDWYDSVYLSLTPFLDASAVLLGTVHHVGNVAGFGSYSETLTAPLPALLAGGYHAVVTADSRKQVPDTNRSNNTGASSGTLAVMIPLLSLGAPLTDTIAANQDSYYHLILPPGADVTLSAMYAVASQAELYVRFGALPDRTTFDLSTLGDLANTSPTLTLSSTLGGDYYILVHGLTAAGAGQSFTLTATLSQFALIDFTPKISLNHPNETINVMGTGFTPATTLSLIAASGTVYRPTSVSFLNSGGLTATFDLSVVPFGSYTVRAEDGSQMSTASTLFKVTDVIVGNFSSTRIMTPARVRVGGPIPMSVDIHGLIDSITPVPFVEVDSTNVVAGEEKEQFVDPSLPEFIPPGGSLQFGFLYRPDPKAAGVVSGFDLSLISLTQAIDWDGQKARLRPNNVPPDAWDAIWANLRPRLGGIVGDFYALLKRDSIALGAIGIATNSVNRLFAFELRMANDQLPIPNVATATDVAFPAPGLPLTFGRTFLSSSITGRFRLGRLGRGWVDNFDVTATTDPRNGFVIISNGLTTRIFVSKGNGVFSGFPGDSGSLTQAAGAYQLREIDGELMAFRPDGSLDYIQDVNHNRITGGYTGTQLTSLTHSNGSRLTITYNAQGRISQVTDPAGRVATYVYDALGEELLNVTTSGGTTGYSYTTERIGPHAFALASISTPAGRHQFFDYDSQGRLRSQQLDGGAQALTYSYDTATIRLTDTNNHASTISYDDAGRIAVTQDSLNHVHVFKFDDLNHVTAVEATGGSIASFKYDMQGYVSSVRDPVGAEQTLTYEPTFHHLAGWSDARGNFTTFGHDANGNLTLSAYPDGSSNQYSYDASGNLVRSVDRNGRATVYTYDSLGLLKSRQLADGSLTTYAYDAHANLISVSDARGTTTLQYDSADRLTRITYANGRFLSYSYNADGNRTQLVDQTGFTINYAYDPAGRLTTLTDALSNRIVEYKYDSAGQLIEADAGNGTYTRYDYDPDGQLLHTTNFGPGNVVNSRFDYTYDVLGRRSSVTTLDGLTTYGYDRDNRLTSVNLPNGRSLTYVYDAAGNRVGVTDNGVPTAYLTNNLNEYTAIGATSQFFDLAGNLTSSLGPAGNASYTYDSLNRLVGMTNALGTWTYEYDALDNRVATTHGGQRTEYLVDPIGLGNVVAEYIGSAQLLAHYTYGLGLTSRVDAANAANYYDFDGVGSTVGMTGSGGGYLNRYALLPFGEILLRSETVPNSFLFSGFYGVQDDGSDLNQMRARSYDRNQGRFTQPDPIELAGGFNYYEYALNNPTKYVDPSGLIRVPKGPGYEDPTYQSFRSGQSKGPGGTYNIDIDTYPRQLAEKLSAERAAKIAAEQAAKAAAERAALPFYARPLGGGATFGAGVVASLEAFYLFDALAAGGQYLIFGDLPLCIGVPLEQRFLLCENPTTTGQVGGHSDTVQVDPVDPNFISGPAGFGPQNFIAGDSTIPYLIGFENKPTANAPAQQVVITETLDPNLDLATFRFGDIGFGDTVVHVPDEDRQVYSTRIDASTPLGIYIDINAELNPQSGVVTWTFTSIDPHTLEPPLDPGIGFLPPNQIPPQGDGWVTYFVKPKPRLASGTPVTAQASIVFDTNAPVATNVWVNLLGTSDANVQFSAGSYSVGEADGIATITVTRTGDTSGTVAVDYATSDGTASQRGDYTTATGTLIFNAGETNKTFGVLIVDDAYVEGSETLSLKLSNPTGGAVLGGLSTATLTITDNDSGPPAANPIDQARFFVQQHYFDFLSRVPDAGGLDYWTSQITQCGSNAVCIHNKRVDVSNAFFYESEFQQTGAYVYRLYRAAYGNDQPFPNPDPGNITEGKKIPNYDVFARDRARVIAGPNQAQAQLNLATEFVQRPEFLSKYPATLGGPEFVDAFLTRIRNDSGVDLTSQHTALINLFNQGGRAAVLYRLADDNLQTNPILNRSFIDAEYNRSFVYTQYADYLRRNSDIDGFLFWLGKVNEFSVRDAGIQHVMVCAFITSREYQQRFSPIVTRSNADCGP